MTFSATPIPYPEIVIGLAGPVGTDMSQAAAAIRTTLKGVGYEAEHIKLTSVMRNIPAPNANIDESTYLTTIRSKIAYANALRVKYDSKSILASIAVLNIRIRRRLITSSSDRISEKRAYVIDQLKRPEEVNLLRSVYGHLF